MSDLLASDGGKLATDLSVRLVEDVLLYGVSQLTEGVRKAKLKFRSGFRSYVVNSIRVTGTIKTILDPDQPTELDKIYVPLEFSIGIKSIKDREFIPFWLDKKRVLIVGTAGGGKSVFMKKLNLDLLRSHEKRLPLYFELRGINNDKERSVFELVYESVRKHISVMTFDEFMAGVRYGKFSLILDGLDEVDHDRRAACLAEINDLCNHFDAASVVITSRPEDIVEGLQTFSIVHVRQMTKKQIIALLEKIDYDISVKQPFIERLDAHLYERHSDFLSNPLLASMMLLTFSHYSDVPEKIHIFYQQAFEVLYQRHDRSKGGAFTRKSVTNLPIDAFQRIFSCFCCSTYIEEKYSFGETEVIEQISAALSYERIKVDAALFLKDLVVSTCLLQRDGLEYRFVHRSFQEYFTAIFLSRLGPGELAAGVDAVIARTSTDNVLPMLADINKDDFERGWVLPTIQALLERLSVEDLGSATASAASDLFAELTITKLKQTEQRKSFVQIKVERSKKLGMQLFTLSRLYENEFKRKVCTDNLKAFLMELSSNEPLYLTSMKDFDAARFKAADEFRGEITIANTPQRGLEALGFASWMQHQATVLRRLEKRIKARLSAQKTTLTSIFNRREQGRVA